MRPTAKVISEKLGELKLVKTSNEFQTMTGFDLQEGEVGLVYKHGGAITKTKDGKYAVYILNNDWIFDDLSEAEYCLWENWAKDEYEEAKL